MNTRDIETAVTAYRDVLDEFREGKIGFVSAQQVSPETRINIRPDPPGEKRTKATGRRPCP